MYSQNKEDEFFLKHFDGHLGHLWEIGANDGTTLSNSRLLIENGWSALLVEPNPFAFAKLLERYLGHPRVTCVPVAVAPAPSRIAPVYLGSDTLLSHIAVEECARTRKVWEPSGVTFTATQNPHFPCASLPTTYPDLLSIDAEGLSLTILEDYLQTIKLKPLLICVEYDGDRERLGHLTRNYGYTLADMNAENAILSRN